VIGGILLAVGLWDLFFVLFRSEDVLFTLSAALLLLLGSFNIWQGVTRLRTQRRGV
jgi:ABC-type nickel/cobalt efflux system permease component RcnA